MQLMQSTNGKALKDEDIKITCHIACVKIDCKLKSRLRKSDRFQSMRSISEP